MNFATRDIPCELVIEFEAGCLRRTFYDLFIDKPMFKNITIKN